ncbi:hypothetical protein ACROYT_G040597 [Oculina patagonica]
MMNDSIRVGNDSILANVLTEKVKCLESVRLQGKDAAFLDGFSLVAAIGKPEKQTFGGFTDCYMNTMFTYGKVPDTSFRRHSIKATTRSRRSRNTARPVRRVIERVFTEHFDLLSTVDEDVLEADTTASSEKFVC